MHVVPLSVTYLTKLPGWPLEVHPEHLLLPVMGEETNSLLGGSEWFPAITVLLGMGDPSCLQQSFFPPGAKWMASVRPRIIKPRLGQHLVKSPDMMLCLSGAIYSGGEHIVGLRA